LRVAVVRSENLVSEAGEISELTGRGKFAVESRYKATAIKD
jgi:hypothetical protein